MNHWSSALIFEMSLDSFSSYLKIPFPHSQQRFPPDLIRHESFKMNSYTHLLLKSNYFVPIFLVLPSIQEQKKSPPSL